MSRKYRILHVLDSFGQGGAQEVALNLLRHADREHYECDVACLYGRGVYWNKLAAAANSIYSLSPWKFVPLYVPNLFFLCRKKRYDIIHAHLIASNLIAKPTAALAGIPLLFNYDHSNDLYRYKQKVRLWADRLANRLTTHAIAVCGTSRDFLLKWEKMPPEKVTVVINGVDTQRFQPAPGRREECRRRWGYPRDKTLIAGVGGLRYPKNFPLFLRVADEIVKMRPDIHFVIVGGGPEESVLKAQTQKSGIADHVTFAGYIDDLTDFYPAMDIFLMTSRYEGTPMTVLEAMACGKPVVAPALDGICEVLRDGETGVLCKPGDLDDYVKRLGDLLEHPERAVEMAEGALRDVRERFSAERMTRQVEAIYMEHLTRNTK